MTRPAVNLAKEGAEVRQVGGMTERLWDDWKHVPWINRWLIAYLDDHIMMVVGAGLYD